MQGRKYRYCDSDSSVPRCRTEGWTLTPLTYSIVHSTWIVRMPARRVSGPYAPYACVIIRVNSGFTYVNVLYMRMHGWACRYCKLRSRTGTRARVCAYMQDSSAVTYFRVIIRALARITALPINTDHVHARIHKRAPPSSVSVISIYLIKRSTGVNVTCSNLITCMSNACQERIFFQ